MTKVQEYSQISCGVPIETEIHIARLCEGLITVLEDGRKLDREVICKAMVEVAIERVKMRIGDQPQTLREIMIALEMQRLLSEERHEGFLSFQEVHEREARFGPDSPVLRDSWLYGGKDDTDFEAN